jgi:biopolymer transport protein ExbD
MMRFGTERARRRPNLTPMIDVVFLLLVFFMLASRFGSETVLPLALAGQGGAAYEGPPRLVQVSADGVALNGIAVPLEGLAAAVLPLVQTPGDAIILRADATAPLQQVVGVMDLLTAAGFTRLVLVE